MGKLSDDIREWPDMLLTTAPHTQTFVAWADRAAALEAESPADLIDKGWRLKIETHYTPRVARINADRPDSAGVLTVRISEAPHYRAAMTELRRQIEEVG